MTPVEVVEDGGVDRGAHLPIHGFDLLRRKVTILSRGSSDMGAVALQVQRSANHPFSCSSSTSITLADFYIVLCILYLGFKANYARARALSPH